MSGKKSIIWGTLSSQVFFILAIGLNFFLVPFVLKYLGKEEYGLAMVIMQLFIYLGMFDFGIGNALVRFYALSRGENEKEQLKKTMSTGFFIYLGLGLLVALIGTSCSGLFAEAMDVKGDEAKKMLMVLSVFLGLRFPLLTFEGLLFAHQRQALGNTITFIGNITSTFLIAFFVYQGYGIWSFAYAMMGSVGVNVFLKLFFIRRIYSQIFISFRHFDRTMIKGLFDFGFFAFLVNLSMQIMLHTDRVLIASLVNVSLVSVYVITSRMPELSTSLVHKICENASPVMVELSKSRDKSDLAALHRKLTGIVSVLAMSMIWIMILINPSFVSLWVGKDYYSGFPSLILILLFNTVFAISYVSLMALYSIGIVRKVGYVSMGQAVLNLALSVPLGKLFGMTGILAATFISGLVGFIYLPVLFLRQIRGSIREYINALMLPFFITLVPGLLLLGAEPYLPLNPSGNWLNFFTILIFYGVCFIFPVYFFIRKDIPLAAVKKFFRK